MNLKSKFRNLKWRIQYCRQFVGDKVQKFLDVEETRFLAVFETTDYESEANIQEFKMVNLIWHTESKILIELNRFHVPACMAFICHH